MIQKEKKLEFQWTFNLTDILTPSEIEITVYAENYQKAIEKIKELNLPCVAMLDNVEKSLLLTAVYEVNQNFDEYAEIEFEPEDR